MTRQPEHNGREMLIGWVVWLGLGGIGCAGVLLAILFVIGAAPILMVAFPLSTLGAVILLAVALWQWRRHRR